MEAFYSKRLPVSILNQNRSKSRISRSLFCRKERNIVAFEQEKPNSGHGTVDAELWTVRLKAETLNLDKFLSRCNKRSEQQDGVASLSRPASYDLIRSPEFKPGKFSVLPKPMTADNYQNRKVDNFFMSYAHSHPQTSTQLCNRNSKRSIFCEVLGDKVCLDCNGRNVRQAFNAKMDLIYPQLKYASNERPYGYCPRTICLTKPLKTQYKLEACSPRVRSVMSAEQIDNENGIKIFIQTRPTTI